MAGLSPEQAAAREAWEEAGVEGAVSPVSLGRFGYLKEMTAAAAVPCAVAVYGLQVETLANKFPEKAERKRRWFRPDEAATLVRETRSGRADPGLHAADPGPPSTHFRQKAPSVGVSPGPH
jgi:8-oxo-dGTP pyrophosphatase MutT (NUDIX family)